MNLSVAKLKKSSVAWVMPLLAILLETACTDEMRWKEQIYLHDGSLLEVDRIASRRSSGFPNSSRGTILTEELRYPKLGVVWEAGGDEQLVSFDIVNGIPYLISTVDNQRYCAGKSAGEYVANYYRWVYGKEEKITRAQAPIAIMRWNTTGISHWGNDNQHDPTYLSWRDVMRRTRQSGVPTLLPKMFADRGWLRCH